MSRAVLAAQAEAVDAALLAEIGLGERSLRDGVWFVDVAVGIDARR